MNSFFFILIVVVYLAATAYIAARICHALRKEKTWTRVATWVIILLLDFSFFLWRGSSDNLWINRYAYIISTLWLTIVLYGFTFMAIFDLLRLFMKFAGYQKLFHTRHILWCAAIGVILVHLYGYLHAISPEQVTYEIRTAKLPEGQKKRIALVSDLHTGYAVTRHDIRRLVNIINDSGSDLTLIAGDLVDGDLMPVEQEDICAALSKINSPLGTFAIMGNHEYIADDQRAEKYIRSIQNLHLLRDEQVSVNVFNIIGRDDLSISRATEKERRPITSFSKDSTLINIVLDHQPSGLNDAVDFNADLFLAGHTHKGQVWPMRLFTKLIYELDYGFARRNNTFAIVTSGYGTWGPRLRIGSNSEVVFIDLIGTKSQNNEQ